MKKIILLGTLLVGLNVGAQPYFSCTTTEDYHDGFTTQGDFQVQTYNSSIREWGHGDYQFDVEYDADLSLFKLTIANNNQVILEQNIILGEMISYLSLGLDYTLLCQLNNTVL